MRSSLPQLQSTPHANAHTFSGSSAPVTSFPESDVESRHKLHASQQQQEPHSPHLTLPPGFMYDYGPHSGPGSPHELVHQQQQARQEREYFEKLYVTTEQERMQLHFQQQQQEDDKGLRREWERLRLQHQQQQQEQWERGRGREWEWERDKNKQRYQRQQQRIVSLPPPPSMSSAEPAFDIDSLTNSLAAMSARLASSCASSSTSASHSNSNSAPHSNSPSKPPSTKPLLSMGMSLSTSSLPPGLGSGLPAGSSNFEVYDRHHSHQQMHPSSMGTRTSSDSDSLMTKLTSEGQTVLADPSSSSPYLSVGQTHSLAKRAFGREPSSSSTSAESDLFFSGSSASSEYGSGRVSRSSQGCCESPVWASGRVSRAEEKDAGKDAMAVGQGSESGSGEGQELDGSSSNQNQTQTQQQRQKQVPYHPGPISIPPMTFNPMQMSMGMIMPLTTMTPGHAHMVPTMMGMMNPNMSPLYHPAAAAATGGGPSSPYRIYPAATGFGSPSTMPGTGMITLTPHGLPPITPSMPPFTFLPPPHLQQHQQQLFSDIADGKGSAAPGDCMGGKTEVDEPLPTRRTEGGDTNNSTTTTQCSTGDRSSSQDQQQQRACPLRFNMPTAVSGRSPAVTMSPGTFYGRPGEVPGPNPYINAAVGAPVHAVPHLAMHSPPIRSHPHHPHHPSSLYYGHGNPQGAYFSAMASPSHAPITGMEPQGYFDPMYFPVRRMEYGGGAEGPTCDGDNDEKETGGEAKEVASPLHENSGDSNAERREEDIEHRGKDGVDTVPSRTQSVGHSRDPSCRPGGERLTAHGHGRGNMQRSGSDPGKLPESQ